MGPTRALHLAPPSRAVGCDPGRNNNQPAPAQLWVLPFLIVLITLHDVGSTFWPHPICGTSAGKLWDAPESHCSMKLSRDFCHSSSKFGWPGTVSNSEEKIGMAVTVNVERRRASTMWEVSLPGNTSFCFCMILYVIVWGTIFEQSNNSFYIWRKSGWNRPPAGYWGDYQSCLYGKWGGIEGISQPVSQMDALFLHSSILKTTFQSNLFTYSQLALVPFVLSWPSLTAL